MRSKYKITCRRKNRYQAKCGGDISNGAARDAQEYLVFNKI